MALKPLNLVEVTAIASKHGLDTKAFQTGNIQCQFSVDNIKKHNGSQQARVLVALEDALVADGYDASQVELQWSRKDQSTGKISAWPSVFVNAKPRVRASTNAMEAQLEKLSKTVELLTSALAVKMGIAVDTVIEATEEHVATTEDGPVETKAEEVAY